MANPKKDLQTGRFLPGPRESKGNLKHGADYFLRTGKLPSVRGRRLLARYLREFETDLIADLGGQANLTAQKQAMVRQVLRCENVLRLIELYLLRASPVNPFKLRKGKIELQPVLEKSYGFYLNVQRQALLALGLDRRKADGILSLQEYIAVKDREKAESGQREDGDRAR